MHLSFFFLLASCVSLTIGQAEEPSDCYSPDTFYRLCAVRGKNGTLRSMPFSESELDGACATPFVEKVLNKTCEQATTTPRPKVPGPSRTERVIYFFYGLISVIIISALSLVGLLALPILYKVSFDHVLKLFTAVAVGTLFGDVMFHLIPTVLGLHSHGAKKDDHAGHDHDHDHGHDHAHPLVPAYQWKMLVSVLILYSFYLLEAFLHWFAHYKDNQNSADGHNHHHGHTISAPNHPTKSGENVQYSRVNIDPDIEHSHLHQNQSHHNVHQHLATELKTPSICAAGKVPHQDSSVPCSPGVLSNEVHVTSNPLPRNFPTGINNPDQAAATPEVLITQFSDESEKMNPVVRQLKTIKSMGWMVLLGDSIHNFADGLAVSAAFSISPLSGLTTSIAVACHELPHELGDYAVLLQSGFSHYRALFWNFLSATTAILGYLVGYCMTTVDTTSQWIFAITIGMFLYIALVDLLPTLLADGKFQLKRFILVNIGFLSGITIMFLITVLEEFLHHAAE